jgi:hypothetical protein
MSSREAAGGGFTFCSSPRFSFSLYRSRSLEESEGPRKYLSNRISGGIVISAAHSDQSSLPEYNGLRLRPHVHWLWLESNSAVGGGLLRLMNLRAITGNGGSETGLFPEPLKRKLLLLQN